MTPKPKPTEQPTVDKLTEEQLGEFIHRFIQLKGYTYGFWNGEVVQAKLTDIVDVLKAIGYKSPDEIPAIERAAMERVLKELRDRVAIEFKKSMEESRQEPFDASNLNDEHKILWKGHANAYSEVISEIDRESELLGKGDEG